MEYPYFKGLEADRYSFYRVPKALVKADLFQKMSGDATKQEKTTDIWFDEKDPLIHIRTHNTDLKKRLAAYSGQYPDQCRQTDADPETGCMEFEIVKGRFSFRLTAPYSEERRNAASKAAKKHSGNLTHPIQKDVL